MKAARVRDAAQVQALRAFPTDFHMLDAYAERSPGGTGTSFDWDLRPPSSGRAAAGAFGRPDARENVGQAIDTVHPFAVDTASGTEAAPGRKDPAKLQAFFRAVAAADQRAAA